MGFLNNRSKFFLLPAFVDSRLESVDTQAIGGDQQFYCIANVEKVLTVKAAATESEK